MTTLSQNLARRGKLAWLFQWASRCGLTDDQEAVAHDVLEEGGIRELIKWVEGIGIGWETHRITTRGGTITAPEMLAPSMFARLGLPRPKYIWHPNDERQWQQHNSPVPTQRQYEEDRRWFIRSLRYGTNITAGYGVNIITDA